MRLQILNLQFHVAQFVGIILIALILAPKGFCASDSPQVQEFTEHLQLGESHYYNLPNLKKGDTVYVYMQRVSGNLDPIVGITKDRSNFSSFEEYFTVKLPEVLGSGFDFSEAFPEFAEGYFIAWNDDGGNLRDASLEFTVQDEGDYQLVVAGAYNRLLRDKMGKRGEELYKTFGKYSLIIGVNSPEVLTGEATPTGETIASHFGKFHKRVQEITGDITKEKNFYEFPLSTLDKGDTLYVFSQATSGDLKPSLKLRDYGSKLLASDNLSGEKDNAELEYTLEEEGGGYFLVLRGNPRGEELTTGSFRLLIGTNSPEVLSGKAKTRGRPVVREPIEVDVALMIDQITDIDQRKENFTVVGLLVMFWVDPAFAYNTDSCKCYQKIYTPLQFDEFINKNNLKWPRFLFWNQQGKRFAQEEQYIVFPDGEVQYFERFTVTLQAPDFNFSRFPFDPQKFFIRILSVEPEDLYIFKPFKEFSRVGEQLGEEEWYVADFHTEVSSRKFIRTFSEYIIQIIAKRHDDYYIFRIFLPLLLIILVSWGIFFMKDYTTRVAISVSNLLIFVAFNFNIGSDLPRLGYMTFMDGILFTAFVGSALTVIINVIFRRFETTGRIELANIADKYITWGYPFIYLIVVLALVWLFFY